MKGVIVKGIGGFYYIKVDSGEVIECRARGIFRKNKVSPLIGDYVEVSDNNSSFALEEIFPRKTELIRPSVANIDQLVVVVAVCAPNADTNLIDKMLVAAEFRGINPILCLNKTDLEGSQKLCDIYSQTGYKIISTSVISGEGIDELREVLKGKISAFSGNSGVGKSSILNLLNPSFMLEIGEISRIERGRHTTRHTELMEIDSGGFVIDTPGFGSYELDRIKYLELKNYFPEFKKYEGHCQFRGCSHINEPKCAVGNAVQLGEINQSRYDNYTNFFNKLKEIKEWEND